MTPDPDPLDPPGRNPTANCARLLVDGAARDPRSAALIFGDRVTDYAGLVDRVGRLADGLRRLGLDRGDRVLLLLPNSPELVESLWASLWGGFVAVPLNWHLHPEEVGYIARHCDAAAIVVSAHTASAAWSLPANVSILHVGPIAAADGDAGELSPTVPYESVFADAPARPNVPLPVTTGADDPAWLFYTSGTTGKPKGATLSHGNLLAMTDAYYTDLDPVEPGSVYLHAAPLTHGSGLYLLPAIGRGATNVILEGLRFSAGDYLGLIEKHQVTHAAFLAPTMLKRVAEAAEAGCDGNGPGPGHDLSTLRSVVVGGAPLYREDLLAAVETLGPVVTEIYGQGESPMTITVMSAGSALDHPGSCGRPFTTVEVRIAGPDLEELPEGQDGQVLVRGDVVMSGYWNDRDATDRALVDGWLCTGDIGHFENGYLYLTDRLKDVIITGGSNVYPREVEEVLLGHPGVREAAVIGVPDAEWGESIRAFVVAVAADAVEPEALIEFCRTRMASFKKPKEVVFLAELPKNSTGKVLKRQLREYQVV